MTAPIDEIGALYVPHEPARVLVLAPGHPWPDGSRTDGQLLDYARAAVDRWRAFAAAHRAILIAPVFGSRHPGYREGGAADFVTDLVDELTARHLPGGDGRVAVHGHSAGAQCAVRYLVARPGRVTDAVISAPGEYAFPAGDVPWPHGMGDAPAGSDWAAAASAVRVVVLAGSADIAPQQPAPGQVGRTRFDRAQAWVAAMQQCARAAGRTPTVEFRSVPGLDHDEAAMAAPAQLALAESLR